MTIFDRFAQDFKGKKILIFGLGLQGRGVGDARVFAEIGATVRVTDQKTEAELSRSLRSLSDLPLEYSLGVHKETDINWADVIVRNAGVPANHPLLGRARELKKRIVMDTDLFCRYAGVTTIGITGTRGKTTTTTLIFTLLDKLSGKKVILGGNILGVATLPLLKEIEDPQNSLAVLELSSWQLQAFAEAKISPEVAVLTNFYPDHLNTYDSMEAYALDKQAIFLNQKPDNVVFFNHDCPDFAEWSKKAVGQVRWYSKVNLPNDWQLNLRGEHNRENAAAAKAIAEYFKLDSSEIKTIISSFQPVAYRLQSIRVHNGIEYINDTTSTTPVAAIKALNSFPGKSIILIAGGFDKNLPFETLPQIMNSKCKHIILLKGSGTERIKKLLDDKKIAAEVDSMNSAVDEAVKRAVPGDIVLLSPAFASFGLFNNEFDRGDQFNHAVEKL